MEVRQLDPGLWRWTAYYGEWRDVVGAVYVETDDAIALIDPLVPEEADEGERFWRALDRDVERAATQVHVLVTVFWHARSAAEIVERYGARLHAPRRARAAIERRTHAVTDVFRPGDALPGGIVALPSGRSTEVLFWLPAHRALVTGDVILGADAGGLRFCPPSWLPNGVGHAQLRGALLPVLDLPVERILVSHGEPVLENGHAALEVLLGP
jgi:glyoxylase-like metal-dependent hydrolase (beta-lactamase superfamily II)